VDFALALDYHYTSLYAVVKVAGRTGGNAGTGFFSLNLLKKEAITSLRNNQIGGGDSP
jgi:hypothetical protein